MPCQHQDCCSRRATNTVGDEEEGVKTAGTKNSAGTNNSAWIRRHLSDSIYLWAVGEKANEDDDDIKLSDRLIGWLVLFMQGFAYTTLIVLAGPTTKPDSGSSGRVVGGLGGDSGYLLPSVTGAMYLLVASTSHDLRAGFLLFVDGSGAGHRAFGLGLLVLYGIMISAAMTVLVSTSDDSASVVLNAVTVLFIADLDEKTLKFLSTVPHKWRLFWAIQTLGTSFALALVAIVYVGHASPLLAESTDVLKREIPTFWFWAVCPVAVTWGSFRLSAALQAFCDISEPDENSCEERRPCSESDKHASEGTTRSSVVDLSIALVRFRAAISGAYQRFRAERCFYVVVAAWLPPAGLYTPVRGKVGRPLAFTFDRTTSRIVLTQNTWALAVPNAALAIGLAVKAVAALKARHERANAILRTQPILSSGAHRLSEGRGTCADSRAPSLLVGWGIGYWVTSAVHVLGCSWRKGDCGWPDAPVLVTAVSVVVIPMLLMVGGIMLADANFLGARSGACVKFAVETMSNRRSIVYWVLATVLRDVIHGWIKICILSRFSLRYTDD